MADPTGKPGGSDILYDAAAPPKDWTVEFQPVMATEALPSCQYLRGYASYRVTTEGRDNYSVVMQADNLPTLYGGYSQYNASLALASPTTAGYTVEAGIVALNTGPTGDGKYHRYYAIGTPPNNQYGQNYAAIVPVGSQLLVQMQRMSANNWRILMNGVEYKRGWIPEGTNKRVIVVIQLETWHQSNSTLCNRGSFTFSDIKNPNLTGRTPNRTPPYMIEGHGSFSFTARRAA